MPVNDAAELREKKKGGIPPLAYVIGAVVFMGGAGFWYLDRASHQPPPGPPPLTPEARAYVHNLALSGVEMQDLVRRLYETPPEVIELVKRVNAAR